MSHKAIVAQVTDVIQIVGANNIQIAVVLGEQVIVSKDVGVGYVGVLFPIDLQLSEEYCRENNLFRHATYNRNDTKTGFFDNNRRVRAQPFMKVRSTGYFTSLDSLSYIPEFKKEDFPLGTQFDEVAGVKVCEKYISRATREAIERQNRPKQAKATYAPYFAKHVDSEQFQHNYQNIPVGALIHFHAKVHGTSHRSAYTKVNIELPKWKQLVNKMIPEFFATMKWDYVVGTRNVVLTNGEKEGFHGAEQFRFDVAESLKPFMKKGMTIYGEIAGYANGKPIMAVHSSKCLKDKAFTNKYGENIVYKYGCAEHQHRFHVYRITFLNHVDENVDFTQAQLEQWCKDYGFNSTFEVAPPEIFDGDYARLKTKVEALTERMETMTADVIDSSHPSEGVILRIDTGRANPYFLKSKSYAFKVMEGMLEVADLEDAA
jgi:hypothetical protein